MQFKRKFSMQPHSQRAVRLFFFCFATWKQRVCRSLYLFSIALTCLSVCRVVHVYMAHTPSQVHGILPIALVVVKICACICKKPVHYHARCVHLNSRLESVCLSTTECMITKIDVIYPSSIDSFI